MQSKLLTSQSHYTASIFDGDFDEAEGQLPGTEYDKSHYLKNYETSTSKDFMNEVMYRVPVKRKSQCSPSPPSACFFDSFIYRIIHCGEVMQLERRLSISGRSSQN